MTSPAPRRRPAEVGMTLLEIMIAMTILAFMMTIAWATISGTSTAKRNTESSQERNRELRVAMTRMVRDLGHAYLSANEDQSMLDRRTLFVGRSAGSIDELRFSSLAHVALWGDADESEQTLVSYYAEADPQDSAKTNLLRREARRLSNESWRGEPAEVDLLIPGVESVRFEYWEHKEKEWKAAWDSTGGDSQRGRLPLRVRITVEVMRGNEKVKYVTQARLLLQEQLQFFAN